MRRKYSWSLIVISSVALITLAVVGEGRLWGQKLDIESLSVAGSNFFIFLLELEGQQMESYSECSGLGSSNDVEQETAVTDAGVVLTQKTPGVLQWHNITLRRTSPSDVKVWQWRKAMEDGDLNQAIRDGAIVMFRAGSLEPFAQWSFRNGWAARLSFDGSVEELTIVHEGLERVGAGSGSVLPPPRR
jgi:phage tail-like protein